MKNDVGTLAFSQRCSDKNNEDAATRVELAALAAINRDVSLCDELHISEGYMKQFMAFAYCYATKSVDWDKKYVRLNTAVKDEIKRQIDAGATITLPEKFSPKKFANRHYEAGIIKRPHKKGLAITKPIKEEAPAVVQQELPLQSAMESAVETSSCSEQRGTVSINAVDLYNLIKRMVDMRIEDALTLRAAIDKLKVV